MIEIKLTDSFQGFEYEKKVLRVVNRKRQDFKALVHFIPNHVDHPRFYIKKNFFVDWVVN
jgi:hypothetical protein